VSHAPSRYNFLATGLLFLPQRPRPPPPARSPPWPPPPSRFRNGFFPPLPGTFGSRACPRQPDLEFSKNFHPPPRGGPGPPWPWDHPGVVPPAFPPPPTPPAGAPWFSGALLPVRIPRPQNPPSRPLPGKVRGFSSKPRVCGPPPPPRPPFRVKIRFCGPPPPETVPLCGPGALKKPPSPPTPPVAPPLWSPRLRGGLWGPITPFFFVPPPAIAPVFACRSPPLLFGWGPTPKHLCYSLKITLPCPHPGAPPRAPLGVYCILWVPRSPPARARQCNPPKGPRKTSCFHRNFPPPIKGLPPGFSDPQPGGGPPEIPFRLAANPPTRGRPPP